jgi:hypothetical protein
MQSVPYQGGPASVFWLSEGLPEKIPDSGPEQGQAGKVRFEITLDDVMDLWVKQSGKCAISGVCMTYHRGGGSKNDFNVSIDRIDSNGHYTTNNIQLVAHRANQMKNDMDKASFVWWVQTIYFNNCNF